MIPLFHEVDSLDKVCYQQYKMSEDLLMEHAAMGLLAAIPKEAKRVLIVAGAGNNGADGIALARLISGYHDSLLYLPLGVKSVMAQKQKERIDALNIPIVKELDTQVDVMVDCLFGSGLSRPLEPKIEALVKRLNEIKATKIACDIPTGIGLDGLHIKEPFISDVTVTMGAHKEALFLDEAKDFVGEIRCVDLGVPREQYAGKTKSWVLEKEDIQLPHRHLQNSHKGSYGHVAVLMGEKSGAAILAAKAAYALGAGLVSVISKEEKLLPAALMQACDLPATTTAICMGMGMAEGYHDSDILALIASKSLPMVVDADLFYRPIMIDLLKGKDMVITPHPKEFVALLKATGVAEVSVEELQKKRFFYACEFSKRYPNVVLVLKGANTLIIEDEKLFVNPHGTAVLAKGGSGDVLGGLIAALLAQGYSLLDAAIHGSLAHTLSAKQFAKNSYALSPEDLIEGVKCL